MDSKRIVEACRFIGEHWTGDDGDLVTQAADYIERLEAVVRAADELHAGAEKAKAEVGIAQSEFGYDSIRFADVRHGALYVLGKIKPYQEARARVTLPPLTQTNQAKDGDKEDASNGK